MYKSLIIFLIGAFTAYAIYAATGFGNKYYNIQVGWTTTVAEFSICKDVKNSNTDPNKNLFVPFNTVEEFNSFNANIPANITVSNAGDVNCCPTMCTTCPSKACTWAN